MTTSRRDLLKSASALVAGATLTGSVMRAAGAPMLGMIYPQKAVIPPEASAMYPSGVKFLLESVDLPSMTPASYASVQDRIAPAALKLKSQGAQAIALMGTSLSFYRGAAYNQHLLDLIHGATGLPATTMSTAIVEGLRAVGGKRLAVSTAYNEEVTGLLKKFLKESGFEVLAIKGLGLEAMTDPAKVTQDFLQKFTLDVFEKAPKADAVFVSCGGLRTLEIIAPLEKQTKVPVVSSLPHALWAGVRLLGLKGTAPGYGKLLSKG